MTDPRAGLTSLDLDRLAARITRLEDNLHAISATPQLATSSIVDGAIDQVKLVDTGAVDENGNPIFAEQVVARIGEQEDSSNGAVVFDGPIPPQPTGFTVTGGAGILTVEWFGEFEDRIEPYLDHDYVAIHVGTTPDFQPMADTLMGTIRAPQGERVTLSGFTPGNYYVTLTAVSTAGRTSDPAMFDSDEALAGIDPVRVDAIEAKADQAIADAADAIQTAERASSEATSALDSATQAQADATTALSTAGGKSKVWYSTTEPTADQGADGDTWYQRTATAFGVITGAWEKTEGAWQPRAIGSSVIDSLSAGKITSGTLAVGQVITVGEPTPGGAYLQIGNSSLTTYREDVEGTWVPALQLGGANDPEDPLTLDQIRLVDPITGEAVVGMDATGIMWADTIMADTMSLGGSDIGNPLDPADTLFQFPRGRVGSYLIRQDSPRAGQTPLGIAEVAADCYSYRMYRATFTGNIYADSAGRYRMFLYWTQDGSAPTINSPQMTMGFFDTTGNGHTRATIMSDFFVAGAVDTPKTIRILVATQKLGSGAVWLTADNGQTGGFLTIDDVGTIPPGTAGSDVWTDGQMSMGGGTPAASNTTSGSTATTVKKTYTKTYNSTWSQSYSGSNSAMGTTELRQGASGSHGQMKAMIGFPSQVQSDLSGASISKIEVYLYANHWYYNNGGTLTLSTHTSSSQPSSYNGSNTTLTTAKWSTKTGGRWISLPTSIFPYWASGNNKGIVVGIGATSANTYYARLNGHGMSYAPKLRITYTK